MDRGVVEQVDTESLVPQEHLLRKVDKVVDFRKLYEIVEPLYSEEEGRPSVDPYCSRSCWCSIWTGYRCYGGRCAGHRQTSRTAGFWDTH